MYSSILEIPFETASKYPDRISHQFRTRKGEEKISFSEFTRFIRVLAAGFGQLGIGKSDHVGFFMNNRYEWISTDMALMALGAVSVPRGSDTTPREIQFIYRHSDSAYLILETMKQLHDIIPVFEKEDWKQCRKIIVLEAVEDSDLPGDIMKMLISYNEVITMGEEALAEDPDQLERLMKEIDEDDLLTIVYTSGTTGNPKGVMLTHRNFLQNVVANTPRLEIDPEKAERSVVMLPSWHVYERTFEYCAMVCALTIVYSSAGRFASDLLRIKPEIIISVPRVWESIYQKLIRALSEMGFIKRNLIFFFIKINQVYLSSRHYIKGCYIRLHRRSALQRGLSWFYHLLLLILMTPGHLLAGILFKPFREKVGGRLRGSTSAAGSLPKYLDELFNALGIKIANAYGMTECAPGILSRTFARNTFGSTGVPFDNTEVVIRREDGTPADVGEKGVLYCRGPQVMKGYYKNPEATAAVLDEEGWLNTGDLAVQSENGEFIIVGRAKDTIVLMGGENVEPEAIEDKMKESLYIDHAVVLGQDQKQLSAIVAVNEEELMKLAAQLKLKDSDIQMSGKDSIEQDHIYEVIMKEVNQLISKEQGFKPFEFITKILPVKNDFSIGKELTQTLKVKRKYVEEKYKTMIDKLMSETEKIRNKEKKKKKK